MSGDIARLAMPAGTLLALTGIGFVFTVLLPHRCRAVLLPALPAVGLLSSVVFLHATGLVVDGRTGGRLLVLVTLMGAIGVAVFDRDRLRTSRRSLMHLAAGLLLGVVPVLLALQPAFRIDDATVVHPTDNHDSYFYVASANWLADHTALDRPTIGDRPASSPDAPSDYIGLVTVDRGLRLGEPMLHAAFASVSGRSVETFWFEVTAGWLALLPGSAIALALALGRRWWEGAGAGAGAAISAYAVYQVANQNGPSLLAVAVIPLVLATIAAAGRSGPRGVSGEIVLAAGALAAFVGLYPELLTLVAVPVVALVLAGSGTIRDRVWRGARIAALVPLLSPLAVYNAQRLLRFIAGVVGDEWPRNAFRADARLALLRSTGALGIDETGGRLVLGLVVAAVVATGVGLAVRSSRLRVVAASLTASVAVLVVTQIRRDDLYGLERAVMVAQPLMILVALLGWLGLVGHALAARSRAVEPDRASRAMTAAAVVTAFVSIASLVAVQVRTELRIVPSVELLRAEGTIRPSVVDVGRWADELGGSGGRDVTVLTSDYVDRLWLAEALHSLDDVAYPFLTFDYFSPASFTDGALTRYLVVSRDVLTDATPRAVIRENEDYRMYDLADVDAWFVLPQASFLPPGDRERGSPWWMAADGSVLVLRTDSAGDVVVTTVANPRVGTVGLDVALGQTTVGTAEVTPAGAELRISLPPDARIVEVTLRVDQAPQPLTDAGEYPATVALIRP